MGKKEKKASLEQLLNSLIEKGWNVFWHKDRINAEKCNYIEWKYYNFDNSGISISLRELVSINSGLWQFVCDNGYNQYKKEYRRWYTKYNTKAEYWDEWDYEYYLIESSLKDESELEEFLLSNIKL